MDQSFVTIPDQQVFILAEFVGDSYLASRDVDGAHTLALFTTELKAREFVAWSCPNMAQDFVYPQHPFGWIKQMAANRYQLGCIDPAQGGHQRCFPFESIPVACVFASEKPRPNVPTPSDN